MHPPSEGSRVFEALSRVALAGLVLGVVATTAAMSPLSQSLRGVGAWAASGAVLGACAALIGAVASGLAGILRATYVRTPREGAHALESVIAGLILFGLMFFGLLEVRARPGFQRLGSAALVFALALVASFGTALALGHLLVGAHRRSYAGRRGPQPARDAGWGGAIATLVVGVAALAVAIASERLPLAAMPRARVVIAGVSILAFGAAIAGTVARVPIAVRALALIAGIGGGAALLAWPPSGNVPGDARLADALVSLAPESDAPKGDARPDPDMLRRYFGRAQSGMGAALDAQVPDRRALNVVWITVCSFRKDRVGAYGSPRGLTPALDDLASRSATFERAYTPFPASAPSMESMFTGLYPYQLARVRDAREPTTATSGRWLPEVLRESGRATWELTGLKLEMLSADFRRFIDGFEVRNPYGFSGVTAETIGAAFEKMLASRSPDRGFFAWIQLMDAHAPYPGDPETGPAAAEDEPRYDQSVHRVDRAIGKIVASLERERLFDRTILIVHGDHGEEFGDHGGRFHYTSLYEEQIAVPLLVRVPGLAPTRATNPVDLTGLTSTVLEILGIETSAGSGNSLVPALLGKEEPSYAYAEVWYAHLASVAKRMLAGPSRTKLIMAGRTRRREFYDLAADPGEKRNRSGLGDPREQELLRILDALEASGARLAGLGPEYPDLPQGPERLDEGGRKELGDAAEATIRDPGSKEADVAASIGSLSQIGDRERAPAVLALRKSASAKVRRAVAEFAGAIQRPEGRSAVLSLVDDRDPDVRAAAALALASYKNPDDAESLVLDPGASEAELCERALLRRDLGDLSGLVSLASHLGMLSQARRATVLGALAMTGDADARATMRAVVLADHVDLALRLTALDSLKAVEPDFLLKEGTRIFLGLGQDPRRGLFLEAITEATPKTLPMLLEGLQDSDPANRKRALDTLAKNVEASRIRMLFAAWQDYRRASEAPAEESVRRETRAKAVATLREARVVEDEPESPPAGAGPVTASIGSLSLTFPEVAGSFPLMLRGTIQGLGAGVTIVATYASGGKPLAASGRTIVRPSGSEPARFEIALPMAETRPDSVMIGMPRASGDTAWFDQKLDLSQLPR